jgi:tricorn protease-like protein
VVVIKANGKTCNIIVSYPGQLVYKSYWAAVNPTWSPDGQWVSFATVNKSKSARKGFRYFSGDDIYMIRADGTHLTQLTQASSSDATPVWGIDGRIYFISDREKGHFNIFSVMPTIFKFARMPQGRRLKSMLPGDDDEE